MKIEDIPKSEVRESINRVASTKDGKIFLAWLCRDCGYKINLMSADDPNKTQVFAAMRGVYAKLRKEINPEHLIDIEYKINIVSDQPTKKDSTDE